MASLRGAAERSFMSLNSTFSHEARQEEIQAVDNPLKRIGLAAIHSAVASHPALFEKLLKMEQPTNLPENLTYLGRGFHSIVYLQPDGNVLKVNELSANWTQKKRHNTFTNMKEEHEIYKEFVGPAVIPHDVQLGPNPRHPSSETLQIVQPFCEVDFIHFMGAPARLHSQIEPLAKDKPHLINELTEMVDRSRLLYSQHKLATDVVGIDNIGVAKQADSLTIIDGQPINTTFPNAQRMAVDCFDNLERSLVKLAA